MASMETSDNLVNPGEKVKVGDRTLTAITPPAYDNPSTT
jgi:hypothetical protein